MLKRFFNLKKATDWLSLKVPGGSKSVQKHMGEGRVFHSPIQKNLSNLWRHFMDFVIRVLLYLNTNVLIYSITLGNSNTKMLLRKHQMLSRQCSEINLNSEHPLSLSTTVTTPTIPSDKCCLLSWKTTSKIIIIHYFYKNLWLEISRDCSHHHLALTLHCHEPFNDYHHTNS